MNSGILVRNGYRPWLPSPEASELDVWHEYEMPLIGTFSCPSGRILFSLIGGLDPERPVSVWAYTPLTSLGAMPAGVSMPSGIELIDWARDRFEGAGPVVYVLARDFMAHRWGSFDRVDTVHDGANRFLATVLDITARAMAGDDPESQPRVDFEVRQAMAGVLADRIPAMP